MKRWWPLLAAIVYVVATVGSLSSLPKAPGVNASGEALVRYYRDHGGALRTATWLLTWSLVPSSSCGSLRSVWQRRDAAPTRTRSPSDLRVSASTHALRAPPGLTPEDLTN
jgi:hypothetical protein